MGNLLPGGDEGRVPRLLDRQVPDVVEGGDEGLPVISIGREFV